MEAGSRAIRAACLVAALALLGSAALAAWRATRPVHAAALLAVVPTQLPQIRPAAELLPELRARLTALPLSANAHHMAAVVVGRHIRESGDESLLVESETMIRRAVALRQDFPEARVELSRALARRHAFGEARDVAAAILRRWSDRPDALAALFDAHVGIGAYEDAAAAMTQLRAVSAGPAVLARQARLAELYGRDREALTLLVRAAREAQRGYESRTEVAWYHYRVAEFLRTRGRASAALDHADVALRLAPGHLGASRTRAAALAATGRIEESIAAYEVLVQRLPHPEVHGALGDLYALTARAGAARHSYRAARVAGEAGGSAEDRPMARLLADHEWDPAEAVLRARRDLRGRQDLDAWDTLAWALYRDGDYAEAASASARARRLGVRRADYEFHAGLIAVAQDRLGAARQHLRAALAIDPAFDPILAPRARRQLALLDG